MRDFMLSKDKVMKAMRHYAIKDGTMEENEGEATRGFMLPKGEAMRENEDKTLCYQRKRNLKCSKQWKRIGIFFGGFSNNLKKSG